MSFKPVKQSNGERLFKSFAKMQAGESITGYLTEVVTGNYGNLNLVLKTEDGQIIELGSAGDIKYALRDAFDKDNSTDIKLNVLTKIVCNGKRKIKTGKFAGTDMAAGVILQDVDAVLEGQNVISLKAQGSASVHTSASSGRSTVMTKEEETAEAETVVRRAKDIMARAGKANG